MVFGEAVRDSSASIVSYQVELFKPQGLHDIHLVLSHGSFGIIHVIGVAINLSAVAITTQVRTDYGEVLASRGAILFHMAWV